MASGAGGCLEWKGRLIKYFSTQEFFLPHGNKNAKIEIVIRFFLLYPARDNFSSLYLINN